jgi:hypothetical protein
VNVVEGQPFRLPGSGRRPAGGPLVASKRGIAERQQQLMKMEMTEDSEW